MTDPTNGGAADIAAPSPPAGPQPTAPPTGATASTPAGGTGAGRPDTIVLEQVSRWYGNVVAVNEISFTLAPGITGLLGPNGAGKSTLLHLMAGLLRPSAGKVSVLGESAWRNPTIYRRVGLVPEREAVHGFLTGREFALMNARLQRLPDAERAADTAIRTVDLEAAADRPIATYSKGMRQRAKIAGALVHEPQVLLLDEPFNGMDPRQRLHMITLLRQMARDGRTIIVSSHILEEVERLADSILVVYAGRLAASGNFRQIRRLMTDRPHTFRIRSSADRRLAAALVTHDPVFGIDLSADRLTLSSSDYGAFTRLLPVVARDAGISLFEVTPTDDSLESVFAYLVRR
jgi:ABC-2 type transport system ATP-binding protein